MESIEFLLPCIDSICKGKVLFKGDVVWNEEGYYFIMHKKEEACPLCGKKMKISKLNSFLGFSLKVFPC